MPIDKWGIPFIYPTKATAGLSGAGSGFFWQQNNDIHKDDDFEGTAMVRIGKEHDLSSFQVIDSNTGEWQFPYSTSGDSLDLSGPTGHHSGGVTHGCQGFTYMCAVDVTTTPARFRFRKETYHVQYNDHPDGDWTHSLVNHKIMGTGNWYGFCWVRYNKKDGRSAGKDSVVCEAWWNDDPVADIANWIMLKRVEDKGDGVTNWGVPATCDGDAHQVGTWSNVQFRFKSDASDWSLHPLKPEPDSGPNINSIGGENMSFKDSESRGYGYRIDMPRDIEMKCLFKFNNDHTCRFKNVSLREIDPTLSFDDNPQAPPPPDNTPGETSELQGVFKVQWDINTLRSSPCAGAGTGGGGGGSGNAIFYTVSADSDKELSDSSTWQNRTRIVMSPLNSSSTLDGKIPIQLDLWLKKVGTPTTPVIQCKIWNSSGTALYLSPTNLDPATLTGSFAKKTFDFSTNTHALAVGDKIGVIWLGTSSSSYVVASYQGTSTANTQYYQYENGAYQSKSRSLSMDVWE